MIDSVPQTTRGFRSNWFGGMCTPEERGTPQPLGSFQQIVNRIKYPVTHMVMWQASSYAAKLGFQQKFVTLPSGETMGFLEKPATPSSGGAVSSTLVYLHGMNMNPTGLLFNSGKHLNLPEGVRCLVPELLGHGSRIAHTKASGKAETGFSLDEYAMDVDGFLDAVGIAPDAKIHLMGYSLGGATALRLAELTHSRRLGRVALAGPSVAIGFGVSEELRAGLIKYAYSTGPEAVAFLKLVGADDPTADRVGPVMATMRAIAHGDEGTTTITEYWSALWAGLARSDEPDAFIPTKPADLDSIPEALPILRGAKALARANVPTLIVQGGSDQVCDVSGALAVRQAFGETGLCEYIEIPGCGHYFDPSKPNGLFLKSANRAAAAFFHQEEERGMERV